MHSTVSTPRATIKGASLAGLYTSLWVPELDALLDAGHAFRRAASCSRLYLSHAHVDHVGALPSLLGMRGLMGLREPLEVYCPHAIVDPLRAGLEAFGAMHHWTLDVKLTPMAPGDEVRINRDLHVRAFATRHTVPSLGFLFLRRVKRLRPEFLELPGPEIAERRQRGEDLFTLHEHLDLAYATDTRPRVLDENPELYDVSTLILECSFLDERKSLDAARAGGHIHLDELLERAENFRNDALVLMHFSQLYKPAEVVEILDERCPPALRAIVHPLLPRTPREWWT